MKTRILWVITILIGVAGCQTFRASMNDVQKRKQCGYRVVEMLDTCVAQWSPIGCYQTVKKAHRDCLQNGYPETHVSLKELVCQAPFLHCAPPGTMG
jgi:hypothetical protein